MTTLYLSSHEINVLEELADEKWQTDRELADRLHLLPSVIRSQCRHLSRIGLVESRDRDRWRITSHGLDELAEQKAA